MHAILLTNRSIRQDSSCLSWEMKAMMNMMKTPMKMDTVTAEHQATTTLLDLANVPSLSHRSTRSSRTKIDNLVTARAAKDTTVRTISGTSRIRKRPRLEQERVVVTK